MWTTLILFLVGIVLIAAEFIVPGGVLGVLGGVCVLASAVYGCMQFPEYALFIVLGEFIGIFVGVIGGLYFISHTRVSRGLVMEKSQKKEEGFSSPGEDPALVGMTGIVHSPLRPVGTILVDGRRIDAVSGGTFIEKDAAVQIIEVEGHRVVVEPAQELAESPSAEDTTS